MAGQTKNCRTFCTFMRITRTNFTSIPMGTPKLPTSANSAVKLPKVLFLDGSAANRSAFEDAFQGEFELSVAGGLDEAWELLADGTMDVVICDQMLPGIAGSEALRQVKQRHPRARRMLITAHADLQSLVDALNRAGVCHYIQKPWETEKVRIAVLEAHATLLAEEAKDAYTMQLQESNRQLEFALRQRLLS
jgi:two-component system sensor histidine kinase/response regulator